MTGYRLEGGLIDRDVPLSFSFNGKRYQGFRGDTLASALLANGVRLVGRSFKYHRPRGTLTAGSAEPNALVTLGHGADADPNCRATMIELTDGIDARSQNHLGSLRFDLLAANDLLSPFLGAGFYYKTFMWPRGFWERLYEPFIRRAAGLGALSGEADPAVYDRGYLHCDVLVVGAGPAGLSAARAAGAAGARVILADEDFLAGGQLNAQPLSIDGMAGHDWAAATTGTLAAMPNVRVMTRTTVFGQFDHGVFGALERHPAGVGLADQTLWRVYARKAVICAGATERPLVFPGNDRPGVMLAGAARAYAHRFGAAPGRRLVVATHSDDGVASAMALKAQGIEIVALIDGREGAIPPDGLDAPFFGGSRIAGTKGRHGVRQVVLEDGQQIDCDGLAISGGFSPNLHLTSHKDGRPLWREDIQAFVPAEANGDVAAAGAANGDFSIEACLTGGAEAGAKAAAALGYGADPLATADVAAEATGVGPIGDTITMGKAAFVDFQNDVSTKDIALAVREGFGAPEHLKRYTTLGMATDQGKTANVNALAVLAALTGRPIAETGSIRHRPPYTPVPIGAFAGRRRGRDFQPLRETPSHRWAKALGASFVESGLWLRAEWYARPGEKGWHDSVDREVLATRAGVGVCDVSTLGKIDIQGRDATAFVDFVYANGFAKLAVGRVRYGLMLREDGMVMDDGTTARLGEAHYLMTTTTANAAGVYRHLEFCRQCLKPDWDVHLTPVTDGWAQFSVAGPRARDLVQKFVEPDFDLSNDGFPFMACAETRIGGVDGRLFRISFSGELAYEVAVPARFGEALMAGLIEAGAEYGVVPYGVEALDVMRIEKGHASGGELIGHAAPRHLGMGRMAGDRKDYIGRALAHRTAIAGLEDIEMVGIRPLDRNEALMNGAHLLETGAAPALENDLGWLSSVCFSPVLGHSIGLGFLKHGSTRMGDTLRAIDLVRGSDVEVEIVSPHFVDPEGERLRG